jgi:hypothetical protein
MPECNASRTSKLSLKMVKYLRIEQEFAFAFCLGFEVRLFLLVAEDESGQGSILMSSKEV